MAGERRAGRAGQVPARMGPGRGVHCADLQDGGLQVAEGGGVDAVVDPEGLFDGPLHPARPRPHRSAGPVGPVLLQADAVAGPALEGAAATRPLVVLPLVLVVAPGQVVEHARAHRGQLRRQAQHAPAQVVDHAGQAEAGAGALGTLVKDQAGPGVGGEQALDVPVGRELRRQGGHRRLVEAVAQVNGVLDRVQFAADGREVNPDGGSTGHPGERRGGRRPGCFGPAEHIPEAGEPVGGTVDQPAGATQVAAGERRPAFVGPLPDAGGEQTGRHLRCVGQLRQGLQVDAQQGAGAPVPAATGQLDKAAAPVAGAVAGFPVAESTLVGAERGHARQGVPVRGRLTDGHEPLAFRPDDGQGKERHGPVDQAEGGQGGRKVGQVADDARGPGGREEMAHGLDIQGMLQVGQGPQPQFVLTAGAADPVRHQPGFRLPPGKGGGNYGGAVVTRCQARIAGGRVTQRPDQRRAQGRAVRTVVVVHHDELVHSPSSPWLPV